YRLLHGSTVATNGLLERKGARVVLVTNRGFEDVVEIGRQNRPQLYALVGHRPPPLVAREDRVGIAGRVGPDGEEIQALDAGELAGLRSRVKGADALAVVLLHSYANPDHEEAVAAALEELDLPLSVSSRLLPEYREYERTSTTAVNAYVSPIMSRYLGRLSRESRARPIHIMSSNGGAVPVERAIREPVHTVLSGPAGGVVGALAWAKRSGFEQIITFDMGGTSTDVSLCPGRPLHTREFEIGGQPVAVPVIDIHTVGAGGGSLARVDPGGALRVGPESAGADPGPVAYGQGGKDLTVTDAHVWLRRLPTNAFLGGEGSLDRDLIAEPLAALAEKLGKTPENAAEGILSVANTAMERALRVISVERGFDPAEFILVAFGGAGALHVAELVERLGAKRALVPPDPGLLSAYGMLAAPPTREVSRTLLVLSSDPDEKARLEEAFLELEYQAVHEMVAEGNNPDSLTVRHWVEARYRGQSFELRVPRENWAKAFHDAHRDRYGYAREGTPVEAVTLRAVAESPPLPLSPATLPEADAEPPVEMSSAFFDGNEIRVQRVWRKDLLKGHTLEGPAIVLEYSSTTWLPPGWHLEVDAWGSLLLSKE
ncbi:MAG: hydantoinase/oxoprolinase family protein, partial [Gemmatimonadales bacterium]